MVAAVAGVLLARPLARRLGTEPLVAWVLVASAGAIAAATLTPVAEDLRSSAVTCDLSRTGIIPLHQLVRVTDDSLNVALWVPFGLALGLLAPSRAKVLLVAGAAVAPFIVEAIQAVAPPIGRGCESADVVDNLTGLAAGLALAWPGRALLARHPGPGDGADDGARHG